MSEIGKQRAESEARHGAGRTLHPTRYGEAINRYLGAVGYPESSAGRPLVVGVDGSPASVQAVDFAITEAGVRGCEVILLEAAGEAATAAEHSEFRDGVLVHRRVVAGDPVARLIDVSQSAAAVVVGRRGPGGFAGSLLGSVSRSMVQRAHCPVFLVG